MPSKRPQAEQPIGRNFASNSLGANTSSPAKTQYRPARSSLSKTLPLSRVDKLLLLCETYGSRQDENILHVSTFTDPS